MPSIDLNLVHINAPCNTYPPITRRIVFSGLENVIIKLAFGRAGRSPTITKVATGIHADRSLLYPFHTKADSATNDSSKTTALPINFRFPNGIAIKPTVAMELKQSALHDNGIPFIWELFSL